MLRQHQILVESSRTHVTRKPPFGGTRLSPSEKMKRSAMDNAIRSAVVVLGSLAFGYLSLQLGFKPFLEKAEEFERSLQSSPPPQQQHQDESEGWWEDESKEKWEEKS